MADEVPDHEEVVRESHVGHDVELVVQSLAHLVVQPVAVAVAGALVGELGQQAIRAFLVRGAAVLVGNRKLGQGVVVELDRDVGSFGDQQRVVARLGDVAEQVAHLARRLQVVLVAVEAEAVRIGYQRSGADAQQRVVHLGVGVVHVVQVVGRQQRSVEILRDPQQLGVRAQLLGDAVILHLDEEVLRPEDALEPPGQLDGLGVVVLQQRLEHHPAEASRRGDEPLGVTLEQLPIHPRLVVVALEERHR